MKFVKFRVSNNVKTKMKSMKTVATVLPAALLGLLSTLNFQPSTACAAPGTAFTYQGVLNVNGSPVTGALYDFKFNLYPTDLGGTAVTLGQTNLAVGVTNGLFMATNIDFGGVFDGTRYWLEIGSRPSGSAAAFQLMAPRQEMTPAPYTIFAENGGGGSGAITLPFNATGTSADSLFKLRNTGTGAAISAENSAVGGTALVGTGLNNNSAGVAGVADTSGSTGVYGRGNSAGVVGASFNGVGVNGQSSIGDGVHGTSSSPGAPDYPDSSGIWGEATAGGNGVLGTSDGDGYNAGGIGVSGRGQDKGVYGVTSTGGPTHAGVFGDNSAVNGTGVVGRGLADGSAGVAGVADGHLNTTGVYGRGTLWAGNFDGNINVSGVATFGERQFFGSTRRQMLNLWSTSYGIGVQNSTEYFRTDGGFAWYYGGSHDDNQNAPGFGGTALMSLASDGTLTCKVLTISGADVAEPFEISTKDLPKGSVVIIDEKNPGQLKLSDCAYDKRVAGILSGANGVRAGICLSQPGFNDGGQNVALSGRVYVLADASSGSIRPGDLLTTSGTPGHAMSVTDHGKAQGAIIGKAMSALKEGKGMVLVLVTLQ
jgi:hypothetical protein